MVMITVILGLYSSLIIILWIGWHKAIQTNPPAAPESVENISVVIPVRNEAHTIKALLDNLQKQQFKNFEVIIVNDHSQDNIHEIIRQHPLKTILIDSQGAGKKKALTTGVEAAKSSIIVTTDADCSVTPGWLQSIAFFFRDENVKLGFGGVRMPQQSFFSILQSIEFASLIGSAAATAAFDKPTMCNGANLAYRKNIFCEVGGYEGNFEISSGDDEFLMRKIHRQYPTGVRFMTSQAAIVETLPQADIRSFIQQRLRWAAKWRHNSSIDTIVLAFFILIAQLSSIVCILNCAISFSLLALALLAGKAFIEMAFLNRVCRFLQISWNWPAFFILQVIYPFYVVGIGVASNFMSNSWKGRKIG
jgi:biofilm PGA synthesis N-glycosyltransferase PgaC